MGLTTHRNYYQLRLYDITRKIGFFKGQQGTGNEVLGGNVENYSTALCLSS
jgi:hypothetical protein